MNSGDRTRTHQGDGAEQSHLKRGSSAWVLTLAHHHEEKLVGASYSMIPSIRAMIGRGFQGFGAGAFDDSDISREHLELQAERAHIVVKNRSKNGASVNGSPFSWDQPVALSDGDVVSIPTSKGAILLIVRFTRLLAKVPDHPKIIGQSAEVADLLDEITTLGAMNTPVLIRGPSGTGKELVANAIHDTSPRREREFRSANCAELMEETFQSELYGHTRGAFTGAVGERRGLAEAARGGTLFLDEIAEASLSVQGMLLRFLEDKRARKLGSDTAREIDVRIVCASNADFEALVAADRFRKDLYFRIRGVTISVPTLQERLDDLPLLARHFVQRFDAPRQRPIHHRLMLALLCHSWPGNIRELRQVIESAVGFAGDAEEIPLSSKIMGQLANGRLLDELERRTSPPAGERQHTSPPVPRDRRLFASPTADERLSTSPPRGSEPPEAYSRLPPPTRVMASVETEAPRRSELPPTRERVRRPDDSRLQALIDKHHGNRTRAAKEAGVARTSLIRWLKQKTNDPEDDGEGRD